MSSGLLFLPSIMKSSALQAKLLGFLSLTSILATAYTLLFIPTGAGRNASTKTFFRSSGLTPVQKYLPILNAALSFLVGLNGLSWHGRPGVHDGFWILSWLPIGNYPALRLQNPLTE